jgi:hypothetical protein
MTSHKSQQRSGPTTRSECTTTATARDNRGSGMNERRYCKRCGRWTASFDLIKGDFARHPFVFPQKRMIPRPSLYIPLQNGYLCKKCAERGVVA